MDRYEPVVDYSNDLLSESQIFSSPKAPENVVLHPFAEVSLLQSNPLMYIRPDPSPFLPLPVNQIHALDSTAAISSSKAIKPPYVSQGDSCEVTKAPPLPVRLTQPVIVLSKAGSEILVSAKKKGSTGPLCK
jgi:hypothetical protein